MKPIDLGRYKTAPIAGALIVAGAILAVGAAMIWFSPYQTCVRANVSQGVSQVQAQEGCALRRGAD